MVDTDTGHEERHRSAFRSAWPLARSAPILEHNATTLAELNAATDLSNTTTPSVLANPNEFPAFDVALLVLVQVRPKIHDQPPINRWGFYPNLFLRQFQHMGLHELELELDLGSELETPDYDYYDHIDRVVALVEHGVPLRIAATKLIAKLIERN
jgi:hypothetical protein